MVCLCVCVCVCVCVLETSGVKNFIFSLFVCSFMCTQSSPTLCDLRDCSPSGSSVHGILQARILE